MRGQSIFVFFAVCVGLAGCRAPRPTLRGLLSPAGPTRAAPPATGSYVTSGPYYTPPAGGNAAAPYSPPGSNPAIGSAAPLGPDGSGNRAIVTPSMPGMTIGQAGAPPQVTIRNGEPNAGVAPSWSAPRTNLAREGGGMPVTSLQGAEPNRFAPPTQMLQISELPGATPQSAPGWGRR